MARSRLASAGIQLERLWAEGTLASLDGPQLLDRYLRLRDEAAFESLVSLYGPMVMGVCRGLLPDPADRDDAYQATFLVLVRRAGSIRNPALLGNWLYGVAHRVAARVRVDSARRKRKEQSAPPADRATSATTPPDDLLDTLPALHEEVRNLPGRYRQPVVLCYLQGRTHEEAAQALGWPVGSVKGRLARARRLLRDRLVRRGVTLGTGGIVAALQRSARAAAPSELGRQAARLATSLTTSKGLAAGTVPACVALGTSISRMMMLKTFSLALAAVLTAGLISTGLVAAARQVGDGPQTSEAPAARRPASKAGAQRPPEQAAVDDALQKRLEAARRFVESSTAQFNEGTITIDRLLSASTKLMEAERAMTASTREQLEGLDRHIERMRQVVEGQEARFEAGQASQVSLDEAILALAEAEYQVAVQKAAFKEVADEVEKVVAAGQEAAGEAEPGGAEGMDEGDRPGRDPASQAVLRALEQPVTITFANETPLSDVLKYLKQISGAPENPNGLPIYVDPIGLQQAEKTMDSPVLPIELEGVPLKLALHLVLRQLDLAFAVKDGILFISHPDALDNLLLEQPMHEPSELARLRLKVDRGDPTPEEIKRLEELKKAQQKPTGAFGGGGF